MAAPGVSAEVGRQLAAISPADHTGKCRTRFRRVGPITFDLTCPRCRALKPFFSELNAPETVREWLMQRLPERFTR